MLTIRSIEDASSGVDGCVAKGVMYVRVPRYRSGYSYGGIPLFCLADTLTFSGMLLLLFGFRYGASIRKDMELCLYDLVNILRKAP